MRLEKSPNRLWLFEKPDRLPLSARTFGYGKDGLGVVGFDMGLRFCPCEKFPAREYEFVPVLPVREKIGRREFVDFALGRWITMLPKNVESDGQSDGIGLFRLWLFRWSDGYLYRFLDERAKFFRSGYDNLFHGRIWLLHYFLQRPIYADYSMVSACFTAMTILVPV